MSAIPASSSSLISKGLHDQIPGPGFACSKDKLPASMFKSPLAPAYRRNAVVVSSYAAESPTSSQPRATTLHSFDLAFGVSPTGSYGIGITLDKVGHGPNMGLPIIKEVLPNGSAFAKLACGDVLVSVNGVLLDKSKPLKSIMHMIKGADETFVDITVLRFHPVQSNDETLTFRLKRRPLRNLSPLIKRAPILPTTFTSSPRSFAGVNLLTPRIDYPPEPPVEKPSKVMIIQHQSHEHMQQLAQNHILQRQHLSPPASAITSHVSDGSGNQQQSNFQIQCSKTSLAMNLMKLPPHQHQELLKLQMQLNHLQQLSLQQQMKTQLFEQESKLLSPGSLSLKGGASSRPTQPQPWPLPPPRVTSQEPDASVTATSCAGDASELHDVELNESSLRDRIVKAEQSTTPPAPLQATDSVNLKTSSQQPEQAFIVQDSERHQVHPSVIGATDALRPPACESAATGAHTAADSASSPQPRGPVSRLRPPIHYLQAADTDISFEPHLRFFDSACSSSELIHSSVGSSVDEQTLGVTSATFDRFGLPQQSCQTRHEQMNLHARLGFASGATPAAKSLISKRDLRTALEATQAELAEARRSLRFCMTELVKYRHTGLDFGAGETNSSLASPFNSNCMNLEHPPRLDLQLDVALGFTPARKRLVADSDPEPFPLQESIADEEKPVALHTPFRCFKPTAMNESQEASRTESLSQSVATSTEMQLLNGEIVYLRQRLQMEILANQELEQMVESTLELFSHFSPAGSVSLNQSSALEAYDSIKRSLQDRIFARQQKISALYKTQMV